MEYQNFLNLLGEATDSTKLPRFTTKKWIEIFE